MRTHIFLAAVRVLQCVPVSAPGRQGPLHSAVAACSLPSHFCKLWELTDDERGDGQAVRAAALSGPLSAAVGQGSFQLSVFVGPCMVR